ncbi:uncharacterized protein EDB93DRAFT_1253073 [Suillus bovinus]|uniref:uncharacterized protein n=1 Tax=Suillus bovinus TaxID=48563 RepID=UPI001B85CF1A|nr:uncharacterized protein EDB93DRAFT_1253073 [Suillus bovinus]KAG2139148.1 hypothetical protein EDB93DRAFT_1253073 [Suillus bovinus]
MDGMTTGNMRTMVMGNTRRDGADNDNENVRPNGEKHDIDEMRMYEQGRKECYEEGSWADQGDEMDGPGGGPDDASDSKKGDELFMFPGMDIDQYHTCWFIQFFDLSNYSHAGPGIPELDDPRLRKRRLTPEGYHTDTDDEQHAPPMKRHVILPRSPLTSEDEGAHTPPDSQYLTITNTGGHQLQRLTAILSIDPPINLPIDTPIDNPINLPINPPINTLPINPPILEAQPSGRRQCSDVLCQHQEKNGCPRSPDLDYLQELRQRGEDHIKEGKEDKEEQTEDDNNDDDNNDEVQPARNSRKWSKGPIPT